MNRLLEKSLVLLLIVALHACRQPMKNTENKSPARIEQKQGAKAEPNAGAIQADKEQNTAVAADTSRNETLALINTAYGDITVRLYNDTRKHRDNFIKLVKEDYYNGTLFHRVIPHFMIQGGDPDSKGAAPGSMLGNGGPGYTIPAEIMPERHFHKRGALAAAREPDQVNPARASSGSQFYIVQGRRYSDSLLTLIENHTGYHFSPQQRQVYKTVGGAAHLDGAYTVFGEVVSGMEVVDKIAALPCDRMNRPLKDVPMKITLIKHQ